MGFTRNCLSYTEIRTKTRPRRARGPPAPGASWPDVRRIDRGARKRPQSGPSNLLQRRIAHGRASDWRRSQHANASVQFHKWRCFR